jgi:aldehyde:ferredoxin oxidoreductase
MTYGYHGKILHVDLSTGKLSVEEPEEDFYRKYLGGSALALHYLLKDMPPGADPLGPENILVLALSVVTGAGISGQSRLTAAAKSPLTGAIGDSQGGGFFPAEMKNAGFDALVIKGKSPNPVYLWIQDGNYELRDASHIWGSITGEAEQSIREELGDKRIEVMQIGPAGEKAVRFAGIFSNSNRANGRTGMGAVMGSKNLKAVAVRGKNRPKIADKSRLSTLAKWGAANLADSDIAGLANRIKKAGTLVMPARFAARGSWRSKKAPTQSIPITEGRNTKPPQLSAITAPLMTWLRSAKPMRSATSMAWTQYLAAQPFPGLMRHSMMEN